MTLKNKKMRGGVIFRNVDTKDSKYSLPKDVFYKSFKKSLLSEKDLYKINKDYIKLVDKYKQKLEAHLENLDGMDATFGENIKNPDFHGFRRSFEILSENNSIDDDLQPLLLKNYEYMSEEDNDNDVIEYHLDQHFSHLIFNYYGENEQRIFNSIIFKNLMTEPEFKVITTNGKITDFLPLPHNNYQINYDKVKKVLDQVVAYSLSNEDKLHVGVLPLLTKLPHESSSHEKKTEAIINAILCNQSSNNVITSKLQKGVKQTKKIKKSSKLIKPSSMETMETIKINSLPNITDEARNNLPEMKPILSHKISKRTSKRGSKGMSKGVSKKIIPNFAPTQETINPPLNQQINNPIIVPNDDKKHAIQEVRIPKAQGLPAFKIELPERKVMIPYEKK